MKRAITLLLLLSLTLSFTACRTEDEERDDTAETSVSSILDELPDNGCC